MRTKHKSWQDKRYNWNKRVIWFQNEDATDIHLKFEQSDYGIKHMFFTDRILAQKKYDDFKINDINKEE